MLGGGFGLVPFGFWDGLALAGFCLSSRFFVLIFLVR